MQRWFSSLTNAWGGIVLMAKEEPNARIELCIAMFVIGLSAWLRISFMEWCIILLCIGGVLAAEAFNSSIERLADYTTQERNPNIANVKDIAAGAVLIMALISAVIGLLIFGPKMV